MRPEIVVNSREELVRIAVGRFDDWSTTPSRNESLLLRGARRIARRALFPAFARLSLP
jgi:hypothetical protein